MDFKGSLKAAHRSPIFARIHGGYPKAIVNVLGHSKQALFSVFDGHSSQNVVDLAIENIWQNIVDDMLDMETETKDKLE